MVREVQCVLMLFVTDKRCNIVVYCSWQYYDNIMLLCLCLYVDSLVLGGHYLFIIDVQRGFGANLKSRQTSSDFKQQHRVYFNHRFCAINK